MEVVLILEEKIKALIAKVKQDKEQFEALQSKYEVLINELAELKAENNVLSEGNAQLTFQLNAIEKSVQKETVHVQELTEERSITRSALDDLIKSIDLIVENENQL
ncbi:MAG TPA: cell division protein ZapB [Candidatus Babeliales bacterium]|nr:cell division protein ZapB [Candidatus Babeliales bacterium]